MGFRVGKVGVKSMIISTNGISFTLDDAEKMEKISVSVSDAGESRISHVDSGAAADCTLQKAGNEPIVYTKAEAGQLQNESEVWSDDSRMAPADFISRCMTGEDAKALSEEKTPLEEYTSSQLERAVTRIREERRNRQESVEHQVSRQREEEEALYEAAVKLAADNSLPAQIVEQMLDSDLPVTPENVTRLSRAINMASGIDAFSDASMKFFIGSEFTITPENINRSAGYARSLDVEEKPEEKDDFSLLEDQIREIILEDGLEADEGTVNTAKWLYDRDLPVTTENIRTCNRIKQLQKEEPEVIVERITDQMAEGIEPEKANLIKISVAEAITAKRRLEETRLTMTVEALRNMSAAGVELDISHLEDMVEELRRQEKQAKEFLLQERGLPATGENEEMMWGTLEAARNVLAAPVEFFGRVLESDENATLDSISKQAKEFTEEFLRMEESYESAGTEVRKDLGDTLTKAFGNIDNILEDMGLEITAKNQRAVRALAYNQMPLTEDNIFRMKEYDSRVTALMKDLKPPVVAELIRREVNPLEESLENLGEEIKGILEEQEVEDMSFRKYLWKMDHNKSITPEERESMIGIYRLLHQIEKSDGAAVAGVLKDGRELSFSSLLSAVRTRRNAGMDITIDDEFGGLEEVSSIGHSISEQINAAYTKQAARELRETLSPEVLRHIMEQKEDSTAEQILEDCEKYGVAEDVSYYEEMAREIREIMTEKEERILSFLSDLEVPDTPVNMQIIRDYLQSGIKPWHKLWKSEESEMALQALESPETLSDVFKQIEKNHKQELVRESNASDINYESLRFQSFMNHSLTFHGKMREYQIYEIPVFTEKGITNCNITIQDGKEGEKGCVEITMESADFGKMQATFRLKGKHVNGFVTVEQDEFLSACRENMEKFEMELEENGFTMDGGSPIVGSRNSLHAGNRAEGAKNEDLYRIAKIFIVSMT